MKYRMKPVENPGYLVIGCSIPALIALLAWFTHIYICFTDDRWGFLIAGAIFFPIAIIHGIGRWIGVW